MYILEVLQSEPTRLATYQGVLFYVYTSVLIFGESPNKLLPAGCCSGCLGGKTDIKLCYHISHTYA